MAAPFTWDEIRAALEEVARILDRRRVRARIFVVGGAAIALAYYDRATTRDVDALFAPADLVAEAAESVGRARGYPSGWLNDAVKTFMPVHGEPVHRLILEIGSVSVSVAAPDLLLAMKLRAARGRRDLEDIAVLVGICGATSVDEAKAIFDAFFPDHDLSGRAIAALEAAIEPRDPAMPSGS